MRRIKVDLDGNSVWVWAHKHRGVLWLHHNGETFSYEPKSKGRQAAQGESVQPGVILAPMPGKIIKVNCSVGDQVEVDTVMVVMEAMKMEYSLKIDISGVIKELTCSEGQQVGLGDVLVRVEADE